MSKGITILVVDDEANIRLLLEQELSDVGYEVFSAESSIVAKQLMENLSCDVILTDLNMPGESGLQLCAWVRSRHPNSDVILMTGYSSPQSAAEGLRLGAADYLFKPFGALGLVVDSVQRVVERQEMSRRTSQLQKRVQNLELLSSIGRLAASVAHEVNNPAKVVTGNLSLLSSEIGRICEHSPELQETLAESRQMVAEASTGMERILEALRNFGNLTVTVGDGDLLLDVQQALMTSVQVIGLEARHKTTLVTELPSVGRIRVNSARFYQTIIHLIHDALDRLPDYSSGKNEIRLALREDDHYAVICIEDDGVRLGEQAAQDLLEGVISNLDVGNQASASTRYEGGYNIVEIRYPLEAAKAPEVESEANVSDCVDPDADMGRALIVDDEAPIRRVLRMMLRRTHDVQEASGGMEAIELLEKGQEYDIILCDLMMPDFDGSRVYAEATKRWPHLGKRFLFVTGGAVTEMTRSFLRENQARILKKPFSRNELQSAMAEVQSK